MNLSNETALRLGAVFPITIVFPLVLCSLSSIIRPRSQRTKL